jgi:hypothetical protein
MYKVYDRAFKVGFGVNILIFIILNYNNYIFAYYKDQFYKTTKLNLSGGCDGLDWGIPFKMMTCYWAWYGDLNPALVSINIFFSIVCGIVLGLIFRFIWSKVKARNLQ